jgi:curved DNA-binding protein CbpA
LKKSWTHEEVRRAYLEKAKVLHPDKQQRATNDGSSSCDDKGNSQQEINQSANNIEFDELRKAYEHLTIGGGVATRQRNPAHSINLLLEMQAVATTNSTTHDTGAANEKSSSLSSSPSSTDDDNLFQARLLAVLLEYGDKGLDLSNSAKKWNQVWPDVPLDSYFETGEDEGEEGGMKKKKRKPGQLLALIKSRAGSVVRILRKAPSSSSSSENGSSNKSKKNGAILVVPKHLSRKDVLEYDRRKD